MRAFALLFLMMLTAGVGAEERQLSDVYLELGRDSTKSTFGSAAVDLGLPNEDLLTLNGASSRVKSRSDDRSMVTRSYGATYVFGPDELWSFAPGFEIWGARNDLTARSVLFEVDLNKINWTFGLQPELKSLVWTSADDPQERKRTGAAGLHAHIDYLGLSHWHFSVRAGALNYGGQRFQNFVDSYVVTDAALAQSSALVKSYGGASVSYLFPKWTVGANMQKSTYVISGVTSVTVGADVKYHFDKVWSLGYAFSSSKPNDASAITSNALNLMYSW